MIDNAKKDRIQMNESTVLLYATNTNINSIDV